MTSTAMEVANKYTDALNRVAATSATLSLSSDAVRVCLLMALEEYVTATPDRSELGLCQDQIAYLQREIKGYEERIGMGRAENYAQRDKIARLEAELQVAYAKSAHDEEELERLRAADVRRPLAPVTANDDSQPQPLVVEIPKVAGIDDIMRSLDNGNANWGQLDKPVRKAIAARVMKTLAVDGKLPISRFETDAPPYVPTTGAIASMFGCRWSELVSAICQ